MVLFSPSFQEVASELKRLKTNKSSGDDQIPLSFITIAADVISPYLTFLIDFMFSNGFRADAKERPGGPGPPQLTSFLF